MKQYIKYFLFIFLIKITFLEHLSISSPNMESDEEKYLRYSKRIEELEPKALKEEFGYQFAELAYLFSKKSEIDKSPQSKSSAYNYLKMFKINYDFE